MKRILLAIWFSLLAGGAFAHSPLEETSPSDGASLKSVPPEVSLTFRRDVRVTKVTSTHADAHVETLDLGDQTSFATRFVVPLEGMGSGNYVIEWRGLGDDGHPQNGTFTFTVD